MTRSTVRSGQRGYVVWVVLVLLVLVSVAAWRFSEHSKEQKRLALVRQQAEQEAAQKKAEEQRREAERQELEKRIATEAKERDALTLSKKAIDDLFARWEDAVKVASTTGRISLSGPVANLQSLRREAEQLTVAPCMDRAKASLIEGMGSTIDGFLEFMRNQYQAGERLARPHFDFAALRMADFQNTRNRCPL